MAKRLHGIYSRRGRLAELTGNRSAWARTRLQHPNSLLHASVALGLRDARILLDLPVTIRSCMPPQATGVAHAVHSSAPIKGLPRLRVRGDALRRRLGHPADVADRRYGLQRVPCSVRTPTTAYGGSPGRLSNESSVLAAGWDVSGRRDY